MALEHADDRLGFDTRTDHGDDAARGLMSHRLPCRRAMGAGSSVGIESGTYRAPDSNSSTTFAIRRWRVSSVLALATDKT